MVPTPLNEFRATHLTAIRQRAFAGAGTPSGGDWALPYIAAVVLDGVENARIADCLFSNLDGIGIELLGYNRRVQILGNDFEFLGASAIVLWGRSSTALDETGALSPSGQSERGRRRERARARERE